jgi:hypothetical protein
MYEQASERWSPVQSVEKVLLSVISMLAGTSSMTYVRSTICVIDLLFLLCYFISGLLHVFIISSFLMHT